MAEEIGVRSELPQASSTDSRLNVMALGRMSFTAIPLAGVSNLAYPSGIFQPPNPKAALTQFEG